MEEWVGLLVAKGRDGGREDYRRGRGRRRDGWDNGIVGGGGGEGDGTMALLEERGLCLLGSREGGLDNGFVEMVSLFGYL